MSQHNDSLCQDKISSLVCFDFLFAAKLCSSRLNLNNLKLLLCKMAKCCRRSRFLFNKRKKKGFYVLNDLTKHDDLNNVFWRWNKSLLWALCVTAVKETWLARVVVIRRSPAGCTGTGSGARSVNPNLPLSPPPTSAADFKSSLHSSQHRPHQQGKLPQREIVGLECHSPIRCPPPDQTRQPCQLVSLFLSLPLFLSAKCHYSCTRSAQAGATNSTAIRQ